MGKKYDPWAIETRPCGDCFWSRRVETYDGEMLLCKRKIMQVTKTTLMIYHKGRGTCFEEKDKPRQGGSKF